ncbi:hypothetical protein GUJ93_ZPchr0013g36170 [Zizania palustris]|uniref:Uncharacterized protein n=1 Tax=Zizania palustris TaxID=103762 RepID=A0A8J5X5U5_ZIZPA|nr:hypothetical protein GUJ93_ZPchr0013g36170 [Zizania palustris]
MVSPNSRLGNGPDYGGCHSRRLTTVKCGGARKEGAPVAIRGDASPLKGRRGLWQRRPACLWPSRAATRREEGGGCSGGGSAAGKMEEAANVVKGKTPDLVAAALHPAATVTCWPPYRRGERGERKRGKEETGTGDGGGSPAMVAAPAPGERRERREP